MAGIGLALGAWAAMARASSIGITTEVSATMRNGALAVTVGIANTGDEAATAVVPSAELGGRRAQGAPRASLGPGERLQAVLEVPWQPPTPGQWPLVTRVDYADAK